MLKFARESELSEFLSSQKNFAALLSSSQLRWMNSWINFACCGDPNIQDPCSIMLIMQHCTLVFFPRFWRRLMSDLGAISSLSAQSHLTGSDSC